MPVADPRVCGVVDGLLALNNDVPVVEFAKGFRGPDVARFREIVRSLTAWNQDEDHLSDAVKRFNDEVRRYEPRSSRLRTANISGVVAAVSSELAPRLPEGLQLIQHLPLGLWLLGLLLGLSAEPTPKGPVLGRLWDHANGLLARTSSRAVLVSRLRQQVKNIKS
jgi:hypothetical protein